MRKVLGLASLVALFGLWGCDSASTIDATTTTESAATEPASSPPAAEAGALNDSRPPAGRLAQANPKLATLRVKFVYDGKAPTPERIDTSKPDPFCAQKEVFSEDLLVGKDGGIKNMILIMDDKRSKVEIPDAQKQPPKEAVMLDNDGCRFVPRVVVAQAGQTLEVHNSDQTGHNANFGFFYNDGVNFTVPIGQKKDVVPKVAEPPSPIPVVCNIHPWMKAFVIVQEHPFVGVTDENGVLEIANIPPGEVTFLIRHESADGAIDEGTVNGKVQKYSRGRMELDLKAGVNDLGTITIAPDKFKS